MRCLFFILEYMTINKLEDGAEGVSVKGTLTSTLASQTEDTVAWIMK